MFIISFTAVASLLLAQSSRAIAIPLAERAASLPADAPYVGLGLHCMLPAFTWMLHQTQSAATYQAAINCPNGIQNKAGGVVLLVHGTGSTANESWSQGPYLQYLPTKAPGYDVCTVNLPNRAVGDAQLSAEYVAYAIGYLAPQSATKQVNIIGHSQGAGCNPQWALTFWPSTRSKVTNYIGVAPDFHGSIEGDFQCSTITGGCEPALWQQAAGSRYLSAQNSKNDANSGAQALVPTIALFTRTDDLLEPETPNAIATSNLNGATIHAMQDLDVCGPLHLADHFTMIIDPAAFGLAYSTLLHGPAAALANFNKAYCTYFVDDVALNFTNTPGLLRSAFNAVATFVTGAKVPTEPLLQPYVCQRGYATAANCQTTSGFAGNYVR